MEHDVSAVQLSKSDHFWQNYVIAILQYYARSYNIFALCKLYKNLFKVPLFRPYTQIHPTNYDRLWQHSAITVSRVNASGFAALKRNACYAQVIWCRLTLQSSNISRMFAVIYCHAYNTHNKLRQYIVVARGLRAAAFLRIRLRISTAGNCAYPSTTRPKMPLRVGEILTLPNTLFLGPHESSPERHVDQFIRFSRAHARDQQTDRQTDTHTHTHTHTARCMCNNMPYLMLCIAMRLIMCAFYNRNRSLYKRNS